MFDFFPGTSYSVQSDIYTFLLPQAGQQVGHHFVKLYYLSHHFIKLVYNFMERFCAMVVILRDNDHNSAIVTILCTCGSAGCNVLQWFSGNCFCPMIGSYVQWFFWHSGESDGESGGGEAGDQALGSLEQGGRKRGRHPSHDHPCYD